MPATKLKTKKRLSASKVWIRDLVSGNFVKSSGWDPSYVEVNSKNISRAHIVATVVTKFMSDDGNYGSITLDDGTDTIRIKAFGPDAIKLKNIHVGSLVRFIGKVKEYNEE